MITRRRIAMSVEDHVETAKALREERRHLLALVDRLQGREHKCSTKVLDAIMKASRGLDRARSMLDDQYYDEGHDGTRPSPYYTGETEATS